MDEQTELTTEVSADGADPIIKVGSPGPAQNIGGTAMLTAFASDNVGVTQAKWYIDGKEVGWDGSAPWSVSWDSTSVADGPHTLFAKAADAAGGWGTSATVSFTVTNGNGFDAPPSVSVTSPTPGQRLAGTVTLSAGVQDERGVTQVKWFVDDAEIGWDGNGAPWEVSWNAASVPSGTHIITARAADTAGQWSTSAAVQFTTGNTAPSTTEHWYATAQHPFVRASDHVPVTMSGVNLPPLWSGQPTATFGQTEYGSIANRGFRVVRMVLLWRLIEPQRGTFDAAFLATLDTAVARAKAAGLYVVFDMIHCLGDNGGIQGLPSWATARGGDCTTIVEREGLPYIRMLANRYANDPTVAAYDPVNEPHRWPMDQTAVMRMYARVIQEIRAVDPDKIIHVEPTYGNTDLRPGCVDWSVLPDRRNVVVQVHDYFGGGEDDGFASCAGAGVQLWDGTTGYSTTNQSASQMDAHIKAWIDGAAVAGLPVWVGEYGIGGGVQNHDLWIQQKVAIFKKYGLGRAWWEYKCNGCPWTMKDSAQGWFSWVSFLF